MKLNPDCARDIMLFCEDHSYIRVDDSERLFFHVIDIGQMFQLSMQEKGYSFEDVLYHVIQLSEDGYISTDFKFDNATETNRLHLASIYYVTAKGQNFIADIKENTRWNQAKKTLGKVGGWSLNFLSSVAHDVMVAEVSAALGQRG